MRRSHEGGGDADARVKSPSGRPFVSLSMGNRTAENRSAGDYMTYDYDDHRFSFFTPVH